MSGKKFAAVDEQDVARFTSYLDWSRVGRFGVGRYLLGTFVLMTLMFFVSPLLSSFIAVFSGADRTADALTTVMFTGISVVLAFFLVPLAVRWINKRPAFSVYAARFPGRVSDFLLGVVVVAVSVLVEQVVYWSVAPLHGNAFSVSAWLPVLVVAAVAFVFQTGTEELIFRGYLMQFARRVTGNAFVVVLAPALVFGLLHLGNLASSYGGSILQIVPYVVMGFGFGWAAWRTGSLWMSFGMHWFNNFCLTTLIGSTGDVIPTVAPLVRDISAIPLPMLIVSTCASVAVQIVGIELIVRRRRARSLAEPEPEPVGA